MPPLDALQAESNVDDVISAASKTAANWIHSPEAVGALSSATGLAPFFVHMGFLLASLLQHHSTKIGATSPQLPTATFDPALAAAAAAAAKAKKIADLQAQLDAAQNG